MDTHTLDFIIRHCGIDALGVVRAEPMMTLDTYHAWVQAGVPEGLQYLVRQEACRRSFDALLPQTKSVLCAAVCLPPASTGWARFCAIGDYHKVVRDKLASLEKALRQIGLIRGESRICVDSAPLLERELAVRAGLGWIAHHHQLVHPEYGTGIVLGELLLTDDLSEYASVIRWHTIPFRPESLIPGSRCVCRSRRCCEQFCPTRALAHGQYRVERCLAYWTTQHAGVLDEYYAAAMGNCVWGCDACQIHCPVAKYHKSPETPFPYHRLTPDVVLTASAKQLTRLLEGTPMHAAHPRILQRNYCYVIGNTQNFAYIPLLSWVLQNNPSAWVQHAASRSLRMLQGDDLSVMPPKQG